MHHVKWWLVSSIAALVAILIVVVSISVGPNTSTVSAKAKPAASSTSTPTPKPHPKKTKAPPTCPTKFKQVAGNNTSDRVDADFAAKYAKATADATAAGTPLSDAQKKLLLEDSANNAQRLAIWANAFGLYDTPNTWQPLVANDCLSQKGQELYYQLKGVLSAKGTTFAEADAPVNGYNSGVSNGTYGVSAYQGISGDRKAIKVTLANGTVVWIMVRCGNVVHPGPPPGIPQIPTDQCKPGEFGMYPNCLPPCQWNASLPANSPSCTPPPVKTCTSEYGPGYTGTYPVCKDTVARAPQNTGHLPTQQMPNPLPAAPVAAQPIKPASPPPVYHAPASPAPEPAPVASVPAPTPIETPRATAPPESAAPAPSTPVDSCSPPLGKTTCD